MIYIRYCKRCGDAFDIDVEKDLCVKCRNNLNEEDEDGVK